MSSDRRTFFQRVGWLLASLSGKAQAAQGQAGTVPGRLGGFIRQGVIEEVHRQFDLVVVGGGISGVCAAISAARNGTKTALVHERSMLGGNSSSEVRLFPEDTPGCATWVKESGLMDEIHTEERVRNHEPYLEGLMNCHWDLVLYEWVTREKNLSLFLNTTMREVEMRDPGHILAIHAAQLGTERQFIFEAPLYVDATGDGVLGYRAGADHLWGPESRDAYHEPLAPEHAAATTMGNTLFFRARDTGKPVPFQKPDWAADFPTEKDLTARSHSFIDGGYWWIEIAYPMNPIRDNEEIRHELLREALGVWDHIKNKCANKAAAQNYSLEFMGFWPYKREARRLIGDFVLRQSDIQDPGQHPDDVAYGVWGIDIHEPGGLHRRDIPPYKPPSLDQYWEDYGTLPYGIPLRSCYSRNIRNLLMAGRPISTSYVAFASTRVLPTGGVVGQAVGVAAALCRKYQCEPRALADQHTMEIQQLLLRQDCFIPGVENEDSDDLARDAAVRTGSQATLEFPESDTFHTLRFPAAQLFPVSTSRIDAVDLLLESKASHPITLTLGLRAAEHVWDFRSTTDIASAQSTVAPGFRGYVHFRLQTRVSAEKLYYVHLPAHTEIGWALCGNAEGQPSRIPPGSSPADLPGVSRWRTIRQEHSFCLRVSPAQMPYAGLNVVRGASRPDRWSNIYISDPGVDLPAWLELHLPKPRTFNRVEITFDTNINRRDRLALHRYPDCVKRYDLQVQSAGGWKTVAEVADNYVRQRIHLFEPVTSDLLRLNIHATNGARSARVYQLRVYNDRGVARNS
jgi:hypothetical protein